MATNTNEPTVRGVVQSNRPTDAEHAAFMARIAAEVEADLRATAVCVRGECLPGTRCECSR